MSTDEVQAAALRAFPTADQEGLVTATERPGLWAVSLEEMTLAVICAPGPYTSKRGEVADRMRDYRIKMSIQDHQGWIAVDLLDNLSAGGREAAYRAIGKLTAELITNDCMVIYAPETHQANAHGDDLLPLLRSNNPLQAVEYRLLPVEVVAVAEGDAEMAAAVQEARRRWPEFEQAFAKRQPMQGFAIKVPFTENEQTEFMWVEVSEINGREIKGKLVSEPESVTYVKFEDEVTVSLDDLNDWIYAIGEKRFGGFTSAVLERRSP